MKRVEHRPHRGITAVLLLAVAGLAGCPIYSQANDGCFRDSDCAQADVCDVPSGECVLPQGNGCARPSDCAANSTCTPAGVCAQGDCTFYHGCVSGYFCDSSSGAWVCAPVGVTGAAGAGGESSTAAGAGGESSTAAGAGGESSTAAGAGGAAGSH